MADQFSLASRVVFCSVFLALLATRTWAFGLHIPIPVTDDGVDKPGGRFSFGIPFHIIWDLDDDSESGKITFIAEPIVGPTNFTLVENVDLKELEVYASITPPKPWPESDTYFIHAANASNPKQILATTSNIWIFDDKPATATLVVISGSQTTAANTTQAPPTQTTTTRTSNSIPPVTPAPPPITHAPNSTSASILSSSTRSTNSSTDLPSPTISTTSNNTITVTSTNTTVSMPPPTTTPVAATSNPSTRRNAIIGGVIGGVAFILLLMIALLAYRRRREQKDDEMAAIPVAIVPSTHTPPSSKFAALPTDAPIALAGMTEMSGERHKPHLAAPRWPPEGMEVPRERQKIQPGLERISGLSSAPPTPPGDTPDAANGADSEEDAQRLRTQAEAMNERIAELESQLVRGLDMGRQPPGYVSQRQSVVPL